MSRIYRNLLLISVPVLTLVCFIGYSKLIDEKHNVEQVNYSKTTPSVRKTSVRPIDDEVAVVEAKPNSDELVPEEIIPSEHELELVQESWLSQPTNTISNVLYNFIEKEQISYLSTEDVPFSEEQREALVELSKNGSMVMFDNTESDYLDSYGLSEGDVVAEFFGSATEGDVILATSVRSSEGDIRYLVLPLQKQDNQSDEEWVETIQTAFGLFKEHKEVEPQKDNVVEG